MSSSTSVRQINNLKQAENINTPPTVMIITHVIPYPPSAGNEIRILKMLKFLKKEGYRIVLLLNVTSLEPYSMKSLRRIVDAVHFLDDTNHNKQAAFITSMIGRGLKIIKNSFRRTLISEEKRYSVNSRIVKKSLCPKKLIDMTRDLCLKYEPVAVIAEYIFTAPCLEVVPSGVLKIIDTHDMFSRKREKVISYGIEDYLHCTQQEERDYLLKGDVIISIQSEETKMFKELVPEREVLTIGIDYDVVEEIDNRFVIPGSILIVGSDNPLNVHGLKEFYKCAWPSIRSKFPYAILRVVGKIANYVQIDDDRVQKVGWVENLDEEYQKAMVVINPIVAGTGLKIKSVEALCTAKPLVSTPSGIEGLFFRGDPPFVICNNWESFSEAVVDLLDSADKRLELQKRALKYAKDNFSTERIYAPLAERFNLFLQSLDK